MTWFNKTSEIQRFFVFCICKQETTKTGRKNALDSNNFELRSGDDIFLKIVRKISARFTNCQVLNLGLEFQVSVSDFCVKPRSESFNQVSDFLWSLGLKVLTRSRSQRLGLNLNYITATRCCPVLVWCAAIQKWHRTEFIQSAWRICTGIFYCKNIIYYELVSK